MYEAVHTVVVILIEFRKHPVELRGVSRFVSSVHGIGD